jgi:hypothetical protein
MRYWVARCGGLLQKKGYLQLTVSMEKLTEEERRMTIDSQVKGSEGIKKKRKKQMRRR